MIASMRPQVFFVAVGAIFGLELMGVLKKLGYVLPKG
jgi:hypothetical protein